MDAGSTCAQLFVGAKTLVAYVYGMKTDKKFVKNLWHNIMKRGVNDKLISDSTQSEISNRVKDILRALFVDDWQYDPHYQHQTSLNDDVRLKKGRLTLSSIEQAHVHERGYLTWSMSVFHYKISVIQLLKSFL